jgi:hypothetical protein
VRKEEVMPSFERSRVTLRISGDLLIPSEITRMLGIEPTGAQQKGCKVIGPSTGQIRIAKTGLWWLEARGREPEDLCGQVEEILGKLTDDMRVWDDIGEAFQVDLFCGLFMGSGNDGMLIHAKYLLALAERGIDLSLDIYDSSD